MSKQQVGIGCFVICVISLFVAVERYQENANKVAAINSSAFGGMMQTVPGGELKAATPAATKYALFFAALSGIGGVSFVVRGAQARSCESSSRSQNFSGVTSDDFTADPHDDHGYGFFSDPNDVGVDCGDLDFSSDD